MAREFGGPSEKEINFSAEGKKEILSKKALNKIVESTKEYQAVDAKDISEFRKSVEGIPWATKATTVDRENEGEYQKWDALKAVADKKKPEILEISRELEAEGGKEKFREKISEIEEELNIRKQILEVFESGKSKE